MTQTGTENPWREDLLDQLDFYIEAHLRPRLEGLGDAELFWEPASGAWSLRPDDDGVLRLQEHSPEPPLPPLTTIAWRLVHIARDVMGARARAIFGPSPAPEGADMFDPRHWPEPLPTTGAEALALLEAGFSAWRAGVASLSDAQLREPLGPVGGFFAEFPVSRLVLHVNREVMAHGAEICLLRDMYRAQSDREDPFVAAALAGEVAELERLAPEHATRVADARPRLLVELAGLRSWDALRVLVEAGFPVSAPEESASALHFAAAAGASEVVELLLARGADPGVKDPEWGATPAGWAANFGHAELAARLEAATT